MPAVNDDGLALIGCMHRPDPTLPTEMQDKRSVVPIEMEDLDPWHFGTVEHAQSLVRLAPAELCPAKPIQPAARR